MTLPLFDAHCDTAFQITARRCGLRENAGHVDLKRAGIYAPYAQFFSIFAVDEAKMSVRCPHLAGLAADGIFDLELAAMLREIEENRDMITLCRTAAEAETAAGQGKAAAFLSAEGAELLRCDTERLRQAHRLGLRSVTLTWNAENALSGSCMSGSERGLTRQGRDFVRACNELKVIVDVSHLSDRGFEDVCEVSEAPFMASHSNSRALCGVPRNLTDAMFRAVAERGGVVGVTLFSRFLGESPTPDTAAEHIEHFLALGGERAVAIGGDFDGCDSLPRGIKGIEDMGLVYEALLRRNLSEDLVRDIFYNNMMGMVKRVCDI